MARTTRGSVTERLMLVSHIIMTVCKDIQSPFTINQYLTCHRELGFADTKNSTVGQALHVRAYMNAQMSAKGWLVKVEDQPDTYQPNENTSWLSDMYRAGWRGHGTHGKLRNVDGRVLSPQVIGMLAKGRRVPKPEKEVMLSSNDKKE